jgi:hypothetical protein
MDTEWCGESSGSRDGALTTSGYIEYIERRSWHYVGRGAGRHLNIFEW